MEAITDTLSIDSPFDVIETFNIVHSHLKISKIDMVESTAQIDLEIDGVFVELLNNVLRFSSDLPIISNVFVKLKNEEEWTIVEFEKVTDQSLSANNSKAKNNLTDKKLIFKDILNRENSLGNGQLLLYLPTSFTHRVGSSSVVTFHFKYMLCYESLFRRSYPSESDTSYYYPIFITPSDESFPCAGYKPSLWLPSLCHVSNTCTWKIEVTVPSDMTVVSSGELVKIRDHTVLSNTKTWLFNVNIPTVPGNICIIASVLKQCRLLDSPVKGYTTPGLSHLLNDTLFYTSEFIQYYTGVVGGILFKSINFVFLYRRLRKCQTFANVVVLSTSLLSSKTNIKRRFKNYKIFSHALSDIIFGSLILPRTLADIWLIASFSQYLYYGFIKKYLGVAEFLHYFHKEQKHASRFPNDSNELLISLSPHVFLVPSIQPTADYESVLPQNAMNMWLATSHPRLLCGQYVWKTYIARCGLTLLAVEKLITSQNLLQVITNMTSMIFNSPDKITPTTLLLSTEQFFSVVLNVSGKDIYLQVCRNWLSVTRPLLLKVEYVFNRRRSSVEFTITNDEHELEINIPINLSLVIQEMDGSFDHILQIDRSVRRTTLEVNIQSSKSRRSSRKRKVITGNGREYDIELPHSGSMAFDGYSVLDNPVLWIRANLELCTFYGMVSITQSDYSWQQMVHMESDPYGHFNAVKTLKLYPSIESINQLVRVIKLKTCWYRVRAKAFKSLVHIYNQFSQEHQREIPREYNPMDLYKVLFGTKDFLELPRVNDFSHFPSYFLQLIAISSISCLKPIIFKEDEKWRTIYTSDFLRTLYEYSDNSSNKYDDCCYRSSILASLGISLLNTKTESKAETSSFVLKESLIVLTCDEHLYKSFDYCTASASLFNLLQLQSLKMVEITNEYFIHCCLPGVNEMLRRKSVYILAEYIQKFHCKESFKFILDLIKDDFSLSVRRSAVHALIKYPPFKSKYPETLKSILNDEITYNYFVILISDLVEEVENFSLYIDLVELYVIMYSEGFYRPLSEEFPSNAVPIMEIKKDGILKFIIKLA